MAGVDPRTKKRNPDVGGDPVGPAEMDQLMRRFFEKTQTENVAAGPSSAAAQPGPPRRDFNTAFDLLENASKAIDMLMQRCEDVEGELEAARERAKSQAEEQAQTVDEWRKLAADLKTQVDAADRKLSALMVRCDVTDKRVATAEARNAELEKAAAEAASHAARAESLSTKLHDKVVTAFGIGSRAHPVMQAMSSQAAE